MSVGFSHTVKSQHITNLSRKKTRIKETHKADQPSLEKPVNLGMASVRSVQFSHRYEATYYKLSQKNRHRKKKPSKPQ